MIEVFPTATKIKRKAERPQRIMETGDHNFGKSLSYIISIIDKHRISRIKCHNIGRRYKYNGLD